MTGNKQSAALVISIDVDGPLAAPPLVNQSSIETLAELLGEHRIAATWAVSEPAASPAVARLQRCRAGQEIALLAGEQWLNRSTGRMQFTKELTRRVAAARAVGIPITTLALGDTLLEDHLDVVIRQGISAIRGRTLGLSRGAQRQPAGDSPRVLHYGLREYPVSAQFGGPQSWMAARCWPWQMVRRLGQAIAARDTLHLLIDLPAAVQLGRHPWKPLAGVLRLAARRRDAGQLVIDTIAERTARLAPQRQTPMARSILRAA